MRFGSYRIDIPFDKIRGSKRILLQLPAGLKIYARKISDLIEEITGSEVILSSSSCFGACDLALDEAKAVSADLILHVGHLPIPSVRVDFPVEFVNAVIEIDPERIAGMIRDNIYEKKVSLVSTAQHVDYLEEIGRLLKGYDVLLGKGSERIAKAGLVLGCDFSSIDAGADAVIFIGTGSFHPIGICMARKKRVYSIDPLSMRISNPEELMEMARKLMRIRLSLVSRSMDARRFGIIVSKKVGQNRFGLARRIKRDLEKREKKAHLLIMDDVRPDLIEDLGGFDCLVSTACPRVAIDDYQGFDIPMLTPVELEMVIGKRRMEDYEIDTFSP